MPTATHESTSQAAPLWDEERCEAYLPIPGFPSLRLTPYRSEEDYPEMVSLLSLEL